MSISSPLWNENRDLARATLAHPFVRGLADGTLARSSFQEYVLQDAYFLEAFARAYALALARCPDREGIWSFFELLAAVQEELRLHAAYAVKWGISPTSGAPAPATLAYTDFLLATASLASVAETCAAMTPCMRLYAYLGQSLAPISVSGNPYQEWIDTYASPAFESLAAKLESLLDRYGSDSAAVSAAYRRAMELELAFFAAHATLDEDRPRDLS